MDRGTCRVCLNPIFYIEEGTWSHMSYLGETLGHEPTPIEESAL